MNSENPRSNSPYWAYYTAEERQALSQLPPDDIASDINLIRIETRNFLRLAQGHTSLEAARLDLNIIRIVTRSQALMQHVHARSAASQHGTKEIIRQAYHLARQKLGILNYLPGPTQS